MTHRGDLHTHGQRKLVRWLGEDEKSRSQTSLAKELGISQAAVSQWIHGASRPESHFRLAIERLTGIAATDWFTAEERRIAFAHRPTGTHG